MEEEEEEEEKSRLLASTGLNARPLHDTPELWSLSLRKAPAYKMGVHLHYFQSIILWVCRENQGTRCNKAQPSC